MWSFCGATIGKGVSWHWPLLKAPGLADPEPYILIMADRQRPILGADGT